jgi:serine/threonine-protein kinase
VIEISEDDVVSGNCVLDEAEVREMTSTRLSRDGSTLPIDPSSSASALEPAHADEAQGPPHVLPEPRSMTPLQYLALVERSRLVEPALLNEIAHGDWFAALDHGDRGRDIVGRYLVERGALTAWQHAVLRCGHWRHLVLGRFRLLRELGAGAMGVVYLAEHVLMKRRVALKILHPQRANDQDHLTRFMREARMLARLENPHIVRVHDLERVEGLYALVMEFIPGANLHDVVKYEGRLAPLRAARLVAQAADGLAYAHEEGFVHRDIKPANLILGRDSTLKISDLGLARAICDEPLSVTIDGSTLVGTADYLSPEQAVQSGQANDKSDVYALGCTLYYLLTGQPPYNRGNVAQRLLAHQMLPPPRLRDARTDVPEDLDIVYQAMMNKDPARRPNAKAVSRWLHRWIATESGDSPFDKAPIPPELLQHDSEPASQSDTDTVVADHARTRLKRSSK